MRRSVVFATDALEPVLDLAVAAEAAGFDRVWTTEYPHRDACARALAVAMSTSTISIGTGIAYAFTRPPLALASLAADVQRLSGGRFGLGIGAGTPGVRRWYGAEFDPPAPRMASYVEGLRGAWAEHPDLEAVPPVYGAALGPIMARTVGRTFDGALLHALALSRVHLHERVLPALRSGTEQRDSAFEVAAWCITAVDADEAHARTMARRQLAFYLSTPSFAPATAGAAWESVATAVRAASRDSGRTASWDDLARLIPDEVLDEMTISGTPESARAKADALEHELGGLGVTELVFQTAGAEVTTEQLVASSEHIIAGLGPGRTGSAAAPQDGVALTAGRAGATPRGS